MSRPVVFFDVAGPADAGLADFYRTVFGWTAGPNGQFEAGATGAIGGALRDDPPDKVLYVDVPSLEEALASVEAAGGRRLTDPFEVQGVVRLALFRDPADNVMGMVESGSYDTGGA